MYDNVRYLFNVHAVERAVRAVNTGYSCSKNRLFMPSSTWHPTGSHMQAQGMPCGRRRDAIWGMPSAFYFINSYAHCVPRAS